MPAKKLLFPLAVLVVAVGCSANAPADEEQLGTAEEALSANCTGGDFGAVRGATAQYHQVSRAVADGYVESHACSSSPPFIPPPLAGAMGYHYVNPALLMQPPDAEHPAILTYEPTADGGRKLVGVEYMTFVICDGRPWIGSGRPNDPSNPPPFATGRCFPSPANPPSILGQRFDGPMPGHEPGMPWHFDLHAWVWRNNPNGCFAQWNPRVSCNP